jgi:hypothetical protein
MTQYAIWASYSGDGRIWLATGLLAAACCVVLAGIRLPLPIQLTRPGPGGRAATVAAWAASVLALLVCVAIYVNHGSADIKAAGTGAPVLRLPILPVTLPAEAVLFVVIASRRSPEPEETRLLSALIGAVAALMIFELPFDPLVIGRIRGFPLEPHTYVALVYVPLVLTEVTTLLLLRLSPMVRLTRATFFCFALMLGVWAVWALSGFGYPQAPLPTALNMTSKVLAIGTALTLFLYKQPEPRQAPRPDIEQSRPVTGPALVPITERPKPADPAVASSVEATS